MQRYAIFKLIVFIVFVVAIFSSLSSQSFAQTCYDVVPGQGSTIDTQNVSSTVQVGSINLQLHSQNDNSVVTFQSGVIVGRITGAEIDGILLSHEPVAS